MTSFRFCLRPVHAKWKTAVGSPEGDLAKIIDPLFPSVLNVTLCLHVHAHTEVAKAQALEAEKAPTEATETTVAPSPYPLPAEFSEVRGLKGLQCLH